METDPLSSFKELSSVKGCRGVSEGKASRAVSHVEKSDKVELSLAAEEKLQLEKYVAMLKAMPDIRPQVIETAKERLSTAEIAAKIAEKMSQP